ncbi:hypothetical protein ES692_08395 [Psychroserpens burtonensis]|uniref:DUF3575 domain-containing protein n=1 Tax=Psychroserpens burtonensis TaxID=49278 RepID=A0A5C7B9F4_9FLAO|nr:hypothetical protein [Psychroserpens burtonensis]TXE17906.1 hypothetical protein ES692_08395 [Psychroserpens burtonensis]
MKKRIMLGLILGLSLTVNTQNDTDGLEKSIFGIQTGLLGVWVHNESRLSNSIVVRSEFGLDTGILGGDFYGETSVFYGPVITLEPRWYYNLEKRISKSKRIDGNSGNFISIKTSYHPGWFTINTPDNVTIVSDISIVPTWGIRRNIGRHFNYEAGIGVGYIHIFEKEDVIVLNEPDVAVNLHFRIGYRF